MRNIIQIEGLAKTYASGHAALHPTDLSIAEGEIFALLGPNGAGKTTLISMICGLVTPTAGRVLVGEHDVVRDFRQTRAMIGLVPQELSLDIFTTVENTVAFSRGLFGRSPNAPYIETLLRDLSLWDKRTSRLLELSGGMKRRVLIAKALASEPRILFLDEPTAGVDVGLRKDMWQLVRAMRDRGVTIILTTHYIEEAEEMADRIGVINKGRLLLVERTRDLMDRLGQRQLVLTLDAPISELPAELAGEAVSLSSDGLSIVITHDGGIDTAWLATTSARFAAAGIRFSDMESRRSTLEEIFVDLVSRDGKVAA